MQWNMERNVVLIGNTKDIDLEYIPDYAKKLGEVEIVPYDKVQKDKRYNKKPAIGQVFIRVPDIDRYILNDEDLEINIQREHVNVFFDFCRELGAIKCDYKLNIDETSHSWWSNVFKVRTPKGKGSISVESEEEQKLRKQLNIKYENFRVDNSTVIAESEWNKASEFFKRSDFLSRNTDCESLLRARHPSARTQTRKYEVSLKISQDVSAETKIAANLSSLGEVVEVNNNFTIKRKSSKSVTAHFSVFFKADEKNATIDM